LLTRQKARDEYRAAEASLIESRAGNAGLRQDVRRLREDASVIEGLARRELGLISPGEILFIVTNAVTNAVSTSQREP
jgi:cell division protein FtsB